MSVNKKPVVGEEVTLSRFTFTQHNGFEMGKGDVGRILEIEEGRALIEFVHSDKPGNNPDAVETEDTIYLELEEFPDYIEGYHFNNEDPVNED